MSYIAPGTQCLTWYDILEHDTRNPSCIEELHAGKGFWQWATGITGQCVSPQMSLVVKPHMRRVESIAREYYKRSYVLLSEVNHVFPYQLHLYLQRSINIYRGIVVGCSVG